MGIAAGLSVDVALGQVADELDAIKRLLTTPNIIVKSLPASVPVATPANPVLLDFGPCPDGRIWDVDLVNIFFKDPWTSLSAATPTNAASGNVANATAAATLAATPGVTNFVTGFEITGDGATAASIVLATLSGVVGGPLTYVVTFPAGVTTPITPLVIELPTPLAATGPNVAITISVPAAGAGNTNAAAVIHGFQQAASGVSAALFVGSPPPPGQINPADNVALQLTIPGSASYATRRPVVRNKQHVYALISGTGLASLTGTFFGTCLVSTVPDDQNGESLTWL